MNRDEVGGNPQLGRNEGLKRMFRDGSDSAHAEPKDITLITSFT